MIDIINFGVGNLRSIENAFHDVSDSVQICSHVNQIRESSRIVLPGVGAFGPGIAKLREQGWDVALNNFYKEDRPVLGICLGFQLFHRLSFENGEHLGLQIFDSKVRGFNEFSEDISVPNIGWRKVSIDATSRLLKGIDEFDAFYFLHSYYCEVSAVTTISTSHHGVKFASIGRRGSFVGVQFHPEKSSKSGLKFISNFMNWDSEEHD